ncbi:MAG: hypothetical protein ACREDR_05550, partial [Blastocatellia bacterium]
TSATVNNGKKDVPAILETPIIVDKSNVASTVIKDGYQKLDEVYKNLPHDQWPQTSGSTAAGG